MYAYDIQKDIIPYYVRNVKSSFVDTFRFCDYDALHTLDFVNGKAVIKVVPPKLDDIPLSTITPPYKHYYKTFPAKPDYGNIVQPAKPDTIPSPSKPDYEAFLDRPDYKTLKYPTKPHIHERPTLQRFNIVGHIIGFILFACIGVLILLMNNDDFIEMVSTIFKWLFICIVIGGALVVLASKK